MDKDTVIKEFERIESEINVLQSEREKIAKEYEEHLNSVYNHFRGKYVKYKYGYNLNSYVEGFFFGLIVHIRHNKFGISPILYKKKKDGTQSKNTVPMYGCHADFEITLAE